MAENSKIEWCDHTFNPWIGCQKVGPGCDNCYAEAQQKRFGNDVYFGVGNARRRTRPANWKLPLKWNRKAEKEGVRYRVFCASLADVFDNAVPDQWRIDLFNLIESTPHLDWLLLTKRIGNVQKMLKTSDWLAGQKNVWLGVTVENQEMADKRIPLLLATPAAKRFISMEPLLGSVDIVHAFDWPAPGVCIDWVIVGGESGQNARPMHPDWVRTVRDQCAIAHVPFMFKQWGEWCPRSDCVHKFEDGSCLADLDPSCKKWPYVVRLTARGNDGSQLENSCDGDDTYMQKVGKKIAGRLLDGRTWDEVPE